MKDNLAEKIVSEFSMENALVHMNYLVDQVGERLSGTPQIQKAAKYIEQTLQSNGLESWIDEFPMYHSFPKQASLKVLAPVAKEIPAEPVCHILSTPPEGVSGELIYLGVGGEDDYSSKDVSGKIVLVDMNWAPARPEKALIAWKHHASALIIMNWGLPDPDNPVIQMGAIKSQWGNPTPDSFHEIPQIPVISISRYHGEYLKQLGQNQSIHVHLTAEATREWVTAQQPTGFLRCTEPTDECIVIGSHLDAWGKSAICNSTGNALLLELSRLLYQYRSRLKRNIWFVFWDGHEIAEGAGSTYFVDTHWQELTRHCAVYINADNLAIDGTTIPTIEGNTEMKSFTQSLLKEIWNEPGHWIDAYKGGGDSSFFGIGVPYVSFATEYTDEELKRLNYAVYGPWLHTEYDTVDKVNMDIYQKTMAFFAHLSIAMANTEIIPYSLQDLAAEIRDALATVTGNFPHLLREPLAGLESTILSFIEKLTALEESDWKGLSAQEINCRKIRILRSLSPVFRSFSGRYGQDACGSLRTEKPIPGLYYALEQADSYEKGTHEFYLWSTEVLRQNNRAFDALDQALFCLETI